MTLGGKRGTAFRGHGPSGLVPGEGGVPIGCVDPGITVAQARRHTGGRRLARACAAVMAVLALALAVTLWAAVGLSMRAGLLPYFDVGYGWFDEHFFVFFGL